MTQKECCSHKCPLNRVLTSLPWVVCFLSFFFADTKVQNKFALTWQPCLHVSRAREQGSRPQITCEC